MNVTSASVEEVNAAAEAAAAAFYPYSRSDPALRARFLRAVASGIETLGSTLIECAARETALAEARLLGERGRTCAQLRMFADIAEANQWIDECIEAADPTRSPQPKPPSPTHTPVYQRSPSGKVRPAQRRKEQPTPLQAIATAPKRWRPDFIDAETPPLGILCCA